MNSKDKGDLAKIKCMGYHIEQQHEVSLPVGDKRPYDLIVDDGKKLIKVQCKFTSQKRRDNHGVVVEDDPRRTVHLRVMGGNQSFFTAKKYEKGDFDILFALTDDGQMFEIPFHVIAGKSTIVVGKDSYADYRVH
jgi:hypothetical protein